jgi:hypothetical protein
LSVMSSPLPHPLPVANLPVATGASKPRAWIRQRLMVGKFGFPAMGSQNPPVAEMP